MNTIGNNNQTSSGTGSPNTRGIFNSIKFTKIKKTSTKQCLLWVILTGIITSLLANYIWELI